MLLPLFIEMIRDPFDRILISQAQLEHLPIMTVDRQFAVYKVDLIWGGNE